MEGQRSLKSRLVMLCVLMSLLPVLILGFISWNSYREISLMATEKTEELAENDLNHIVESLYTTCEVQHGLAMQIIENAMKTSESILTELGALFPREDQPVLWDAVNQYTKKRSPVTLPALYAGETWLGQNHEPHVMSPVVDKTRDLSVETCTIFQRMTPQGDMLRVVTNVMKTNKERAIGTYIPAVNPDGASNPVISTVLQGNVFLGRAFVVNDWYLTAYKPLYGPNRDVIGVLYVGIKQKTIEKTLLSKIKKIRIATSGHVSIMNSMGNILLTDVTIPIPKEKVETIVSQTVQSASGGTLSFRFLGETKAQRCSIVKTRYFKPWDWIIVTCVPEDELMAASVNINLIKQRALRTMAIAAVCFIAVSLLFSVGLSTRLSRQLMTFISQLSRNSHTVSNLSQNFEIASQQLDGGAVQLTDSIHRVTASMDEMAAMIKQNADSAGQADREMKDAIDAIHEANGAMGQLTRSMEGISKASEETSNIIKTINEIAFQTNLLALNAAVEAARAGEAGAGFAVVAEEVRNLALRSAEAAKTTAALIQGTMDKVNEGSALVSTTNQDFQRVSDSSEKVGELISNISESSNEQAAKIDQVNGAVVDMEQIIQQSDNQIKIISFGTDEIGAQSQQFNGIVHDLEVVVLGGHKGFSPQSVETVSQSRRNTAALLPNLESGKVERSDKKNPLLTQECELLSKCGFFQKYMGTYENACEKMISDYCKGPGQVKCKRKAYRKKHGKPPIDDMLPTGGIFQG